MTTYTATVRSSRSGERLAITTRRYSAGFRVEHLEGARFAKWADEALARADARMVAAEKGFDPETVEVWHQSQ